MSGVRVKKAVATLLLVLFWPQWALAQSAVAAGVVTTLAGQATVTRVSLPQQPVPLRFKDEVFVRDTIRTREKSVVRMLLGGKALVTVRELSVFMITEEEGRSRVDLETGKIALSVARQRMRPGEVIEIRTPNAIAGVRGTVVIAEIVRSTAQLGPGGSGVTTNFYVLKGSIDVVPRGVAGATPSVVGPLQSVSVTGSTASQVRTIPAGQVGQIVSGLKSGPQHQETPDSGKKQVNTTQQQQATALAVLLAPEPAAPAGQQQPPQQQGQADPNLVAAASPIADPTPTPLGGSPTPSNPVNPPIIPPVPPGPSGPPDIPSVAPISNTTRSLTAAETLLTLPSGTSVQQQPSTLVSVSNSTVTQSPTGNLFLSPAGANSTTVGNLLNAMNSNLTAGSHLLEVAGALSSSANLLAIDPTFVTAPNLIQVDLGGSLTVAGSLLTDIGGTYTVSGDVTTIFGTLSTTSTAPAFSLSSTTVNSGTDSLPTHFFRVNGGSGVATMAGPLITAANVSYTQRGSAVLEVSGGGSLTSTATSPFMSFSGGSFTLGNGVVGTLIGTGSTTTLAGSLFAAAGTTLNVSGSGRHFIEVSGGSSLTVGGGIDLSNTSLNLGTEPLIKVLNASTLRFTGSAPALRLTNASLTADQLVFADGTGNTFELRGTALSLTNSTLSLRAYGNTDSGLDTDRFTSLSLNQPFAQIASSTLTTTQLGEGGFDLGDNSAATPPTVPGVGLIATGTTASPTTINLEGKLFQLKAGTFTATNPLVQLDHTTVNQTVTTDPLTRIDFQGRTGSTTGQFLTASSSTLNASGEVFRLQNASLTSNTTSPFFGLTSTGITAPNDHVLSLGWSGSLTLAGGLFGATGGTLNAVDSNLNTATGSVVTGFTPIGVAVTPDGSRVYVANSAASTVTVVDTSTNTPIATVSLPVGSGPDGMVAVTPDGARVYVANGNTGTVSIINTATNTVGTSVPVGGAPLGIAIAPNGARVYVANRLSNSLSIIDNTLPTPAQIATVTVGTNPGGVAVTPDGSRVWVANQNSNNISVISTATNALVATVTSGLGTTPLGVAITPDGTRAYVTNFGSGTVSVIDTATNAVTATITVGTQPRSVAITPDGTRAFVTNVGSGTVSVLNLSNNTLMATVTVGASPEEIGLAHDRAYVTTAGPNRLMVLDTNPGGRFLSVGSGATLTSNGTASLLAFDGSSVSTGRTFVGVDGTLQLRSALVEAVNGATLSTNGSFLGVLQGGTLTDTAAVPSANALLSFTGGSVSSTAGNLVTVSGNGSPAGAATMTLRRPLFAGSNTAVSAFFNFFRIGDGGSVTSTATSPLIQLAGGSYTGGNGGGTGNFLRMFSFANQNANSLSLAGGLLSASGGATLTATNGPFVDIRDSATVTSTGSAPFLDFNNASASSHYNFIAFGAGGSSSGGTGTNVAPTASFAGSLLRAADTGTALTFSNGNGNSFISIFDGASVTDTGTSALLDFVGSGANMVAVNAGTNLLFLGTTATGRSAPSLTIAGSLVGAQNATVTSGAPASNAYSLVFVGDGATLTSTSSSALLSFTTSTVDTAGNLLTVRRSSSVATPSTVTLSGPLFTASGSTLNTTSLGLVTAACCDGFFVGQGARLTSGTASPLVQLTGSTFTGRDSQSGGDLFGVFDTYSTAAAGDLVAPASVSLTNSGGSLLRVTDGSLSALFALLAVGRSSFTSTGTGPLVEFGGSTGPTITLGGLDPISNTTTTGGRLLTLISSPTPGQADNPAGTRVFPASASLAGSLLSATSGSITATGELVGIFNGASLSSTTTSPLISLTNTALTTGTSPFSGGGQLFYLGGQGSTSGTTLASASLRGPILNASNSPLNLSGGLLKVAAGAQLDTGGDTNPLFSITGGAHSIATNSGSAIAALFGRASTQALDTVDPEAVDAAGTTLTLGTDTPVRNQAGDGLDLSGATVGGTTPSQHALILDSALIRASAPLLNMTALSSLTTALDAITLQNRASLISVGPIVKLDNSTLTINSGAAVNMTGGSFLRITGDLITLSNGSTLRILSGPALSLTGGSVVNISGALIAFGTLSGNTVNITNNLCAISCFTPIAGLPSFRVAAPALTNFSISPNAVRNLGSNNLSVSSNAAVISISGANSRVTIQGN